MRGANAEKRRRGRKVLLPVAIVSNGVELFERLKSAKIIDKAPTARASEKMTCGEGLFVSNRTAGSTCGGYHSRMPV